MTGIGKNQKLKGACYIRQDSTRAVSEVIGSYLLISIVVLAVAIIGVVLLSQTTPAQIPNVNFMVGTDASGNMYLYHNGGDPLTLGQFNILVDAKPVTTFRVSDNTSTWSLGKNLIVTGVSSGSHTVALIYNNSATGTIVLRSASANYSAIPQNINPDVIPTMYPPYIDITQLGQNVTNRSVVFYRAANMSMTSGSYLKFNVTRRNSTLFVTPSCGSNPYILNITDVVTISQVDTITQGFHVIGVGDQIFELNADKVTLLIQNSAGATQCAPAVPVVINHTFITGYTNLKTTLAVSTSALPGTYFTALAINNYSTLSDPMLNLQLMDTPNSSLLTLSGIGPAASGFFVFHFDNSTKGTYVAGNVTAITINGAPVFQ